MNVHEIEKRIAKVAHVLGFRLMDVVVTVDPEEKADGLPRHAMWEGSWNGIQIGGMLPIHKGDDPSVIADAVVTNAAFFLCLRKYPFNNHVMEAIQVWRRWYSDGLFKGILKQYISSFVLNSDSVLTVTEVRQRLFSDLVTDEEIKSIIALHPDASSD